MISTSIYYFLVFLTLSSRNRISVITDILVLEFYVYIENIGGYFDKNIGKTKNNKNILKFMKNFVEKDINKQIYTY